MKVKWNPSTDFEWERAFGREKKANVKQKRQIQNATRNLKCKTHVQHSTIPQGKRRKKEEKKLMPIFFCSFIHYFTLRPFIWRTVLPFLSLFRTSNIESTLSFIQSVQIYCLRLPVSSLAFALNMCLIIMIYASMRRRKTGNGQHSLETHFMCNVQCANSFA